MTDACKATRIIAACRVSPFSRSCRDHKRAATAHRISNAQTMASNTRIFTKGIVPCLRRSACGNVPSSFFRFGNVIRVWDKFTDNHAALYFPCANYRFTRNGIVAEIALYFIDPSRSLSFGFGDSGRTRNIRRIHAASFYHPGAKNAEIQSIPLPVFDAPPPAR
jgi:hypothetical protein